MVFPEFGRGGDRLETLIQNCPQEYYSTDNRWSTLAMYIRVRGTVGDQIERFLHFPNQMHAHKLKLRQIAQSPSISQEQRWALCGWFVQNIFNEFPQEYFHSINKK